MAFKCRKIKNAVAAEFDIPLKLIDSRIRTTKVARARMAAAYICRRDIRPEMSLPWIGRQFGLDHSTIHHAVKRIDQLMAADPAYAARVERCRAAVQP